MCGAFELEPRGCFAHFLLELGDDSQFVIGFLIFGDKRSIDEFALLAVVFLGLQDVLESAFHALRSDAVGFVVLLLALAAVVRNVE